MKRITYICAILLSSVLMFSCSDYLEAPPSVDLDEDGVFADRTLTEQYITGIYAEGMPLGYCHSNRNFFHSHNLYHMSDRCQPISLPCLIIRVNIILHFLY